MFDTMNRKPSTLKNKPTAGKKPGKKSARKMASPCWEYNCQNTMRKHR